jgi:hypothetical protein
MIDAAMSNKSIGGPFYGPEIRTCVRAVRHAPPCTITNILARLETKENKFINSVVIVKVA